MQTQVAYFDNAATTFPKPEAVYRAMDEFARSCGINYGRGQHLMASKAASVVDETENLILNLFHCSNKKVVLTNTATEALNIIIRGIEIPENGIVYISPFEHNAVTRTLYHLQKTRNIRIEQLSADKDTFEYDMDRIKAQFNDLPPDCVIVSGASNVIGAVAPVNDLFCIAKPFNAITIADMCQTAGLVDIDISSSVYDYVVFAGHKTLYGPLGVSGFISSHPETLTPLIYGGTGIDSANQDMPAGSPERFQAGSHNTTAIAGLNSAVKWILETGIETIYQKECDNTERLLDILDQYDNINVFKPKNRIGVISCTFDGYTSDEIGQILSSRNIAFRSGLQCAPYAHRFIGTFPAGTVRLSVGYFNTDRDFEMLDNALRYIYENS